MFIIVVLGILAAIAVPKFAATRDDAHIANARSTISAVRSGIVAARQKSLLRGNSGYINVLSTSNATLFDGNGSTGYQILMYPVTASSDNGHWTRSGAGSYTFHILGKSCNFTYNNANGMFTMNGGQPAECSALNF